MQQRRLLSNYLSLSIVRGLNKISFASKPIVLLLVYLNPGLTNYKLS